MDSKLIRSNNAFNGDQFNFQPGRVHGVELFFKGTNIAGQVGAFSDLGSLVLTRDGRQIANADIGSIANMDDIRFGGVLFSSTDGGLFIGSVFVPFFESTDDDSVFHNALEIRDESELNMEWIPKAGLDAIFADLSITTYAELAAYSEIYEPRLLRDNQNEDGAVAGKPYQLNKDNITSLYMVDVDDVVDLVGFEQNGRSIVSPQGWDVLEAKTLRNNRLEVGSFPMIEVQTYSKGNTASSVNRDSVLSLTTNAGGKVDILTVSLHWWN